MAIKTRSLTAKIPYHIEFERRPPRKLFAYYGELFGGSTLHALPDFFTTSNACYRIVWGTVLLTAILACAFHLYVNLAEVIESPTVSRNSYECKQEMAFPRIQICAQTGRMLNPWKLQPALENNTISIEYIYALELGLGVYNHQDNLLNSGRLNFTIIEQQYHHAITNHGSIMAAWQHLYSTYGLTCNQVMAYCTTGTFRQITNCCELFEWVDTLFGRCLATKNDTALTDKYRGNLAGYHFWVRSNPTFNVKAVNETVKVTLDPQPHIVGINNGLDQTLQWPDPYYLYPQASVRFAIRQRRRKLIPSSNCVVNPSLKYFQNYTLTNCVWEQNFIDRLPTAINFTCILPILTLLNPDTAYQTSFSMENLCNFSEIRHFYRLENGKGIRPKSMWSVLAEVDSVPRAPGDTADPCPLPCEYTEYLYMATQLNDFSMQTTQFHIQLHYPTMEYELVEEVPRLSISDYVSLIGGTFGLWLGASLITLVHLMALMANATWNVYLKPKLRALRSPPTSGFVFDENEHQVNLQIVITNRF